MSSLPVKLIAAASENLGIGINNGIPWRLKNEMAYFTKMTQVTKEQGAVNAVVMGRRTWESIPPRYRPLSGRLNVVLSSNISGLNLPEGVLGYGSLQAALDALSAQDKPVENIWIVGGSSLYKESMEHPWCTRVYLTKIKKFFDCDTFFPEISPDFRLLADYGDEADLVPTEMQTEDGIDYQYTIYERRNK